ncbi:MAG: sugar phosphate isomerase/epimerase [Eubacteriales bacterium]|nr:sugar phosphate isomerase/epimerase [Eubacteriales bacterium]
MKPLIGYQLYSARAEAEKDFEGTLKALKDMGYDGIEFAGFFDRKAEDVAAMLQKLGLKAASSHVPFRAILADPDGVISYHKALNCQWIAVPYLEDADRPGTPGFGKVVREISLFGRKCHEAGIQLLYHNHDFEFVKVSGEYGLDFLYDAIEPEALQTELDTCWVKYSGENPVDYLRKYAGRAPIVHLKDYVGVKSELPPYALIGQAESAPKGEVPFMFKPFGFGCQDAQAVIAAAEEAGAQWVIVEQDESPERTPLESAAMSLSTVKKYV